MELKNYSDYQARFAENQAYSNYGIDTTAHLPCPFCAAPDFMVYKIIEIETVMQKEHTCSECGRAAKALLQYHRGSKTFEMVQTAGPDQPEWLPPMRRVS